jgi:hypothetical protein
LLAVAVHEGHATWATFVIDGEVVERSVVHLKRKLAAGLHRVRVSRPGYRDAETSLTVRAGRITRVRIPLEKE